MHHFPLVAFVCLGIALTAGAAAANLDPGLAGGPPLTAPDLHMAPHPDPNGCGVRFGVPEVHMAPYPDPHGNRLRLGVPEVRLASHPDSGG